jgi:bifunctional oligoribonuclease and PAP phosphatase NrnA
MSGDALQAAADALSRTEHVALACHVNPDPDALGSMLGLSVFLRSRGVESVCSFGNEPFEPPRWLEALPAVDTLVPPREFPKAPALLVTLDCASLDRLGNLAGVVQRAGSVIWIDHHASNPGLGTIPVIDPAASSTAELVHRLMVRMGGDVPAEAAACLYAGLVTDTGRFQYQATTPETLRLAATLREHGFDHARLAQALFADQSVAYLRVLATTLHRVVLDEEAGVVWTYLLQSDLSEDGVRIADADDLIDVVRTAREADVAAVVKQQRDGRFKVSLRSRGATDVGSVAAAFGGGGHRLAAGYASRGGLDETVQRLREALIASRSPDPASDPA